MSPHMPLQAIYQEIIQANTALSLYLCISHPLSPHLLSLASSLYPLVILYPFCERAFRWAWGRINTVWSIFAWHTAPVAAHGGGGEGKVWGQGWIEQSIESACTLSEGATRLLQWGANSPAPLWESETSLHKIIYTLWIEMTDRLLGCSDIFKGQP